jgi:hypothetical protein
LTGHVYTTGALAAHGCVYSTEAFAATGSVCTTGALKCVPWEIYKILNMEITSEIPRNFVKQCNMEFREIPRNLGDFAQNTEVTAVHKIHTKFRVDRIPWTEDSDTLSMDPNHRLEQPGQKLFFFNIPLFQKKI